eukprot:TRINITY_DN2681_c0_g1_i1.p1 TRINITY_DN2681_c0_g1~~TRINITY_DN2681_c0_g1_i1.p1  ORF type:complete len:615 (+),score=102.86 TRINITY_DN2681_c0_g1_i1:66-1910(+)
MREMAPVLPRDTAAAPGIPVPTPPQMPGRGTGRLSPPRCSATAAERSPPRQWLTGWLGAAARPRARIWVRRSMAGAAVLSLLAMGLNGFASPFPFILSDDQSEFVRPDDWNVTLIPRIIHQTWRNETLPAYALDPVRSWAERNPGHRHLLWTDRQMDNYVRNHFEEIYAGVWRDARPIERADLFRYLVLLREGGWYADIDTTCLRPLEHWSSSHRAFGAIEAVVGMETIAGPHWEHDDHPRRIQVLQWSMGFVPGHPILRDVVRRVVQYHRRHGIDRMTDVMESTGPGPWTDAVWDYATRVHKIPLGFQPFSPQELVDRGARIGGLLVLPRRAMGCCAGCCQEYSASGSQQLVVHHYAGSWREMRPIVPNPKGPTRTVGLCEGNDTACWRELRGIATHCHRWCPFNQTHYNCTGYRPGKSSQCFWPTLEMAMLWCGRWAECAAVYHDGRRYLARQQEDLTTQTATTGAVTWVKRAAEAALAAPWRPSGPAAAAGWQEGPAGEAANWLVAEGDVDGAAHALETAQHMLKGAVGALLEGGGAVAAARDNATAAMAAVEAALGALDSLLNSTVTASAELDDSLGAQGDSEGDDFAATPATGYYSASSPRRGTLRRGG